MAYAKNWEASLHLNLRTLAVRRAGVGGRDKISDADEDAEDASKKKW